MSEAHPSSASPWQTVVEPASGDCYWWNTLTSETSWDRPPGAPPAPPPPRPADAADAAAGAAAPVEAVAGAVVDASGEEICGPDDAFDFADAGGGLCGPDDGFDYGDAGGALCGPDDAVVDGAAAGGMGGPGHAGYAGQGPPPAFNEESDSDEDSEEERIAFERDKVRVALSMSVVGWCWCLMISLTASDRSATYLSVVLLSPPTGYYSASRILCVVSRVSCTPCHHSAVWRVVLPYLLPLSPSVVLTCKPLPCPRAHTHTHTPHLLLRISGRPVPTHARGEERPGFRELGKVAPEARRRCSVPAPSEG